MESGFLVINKDKGIGSTKAVSIAKRILKPKKIGHAGTLDPLAEGVLILAINEATKVIRFVEGAKKQYEFDVFFGAETTTCDAEGEIINQSEKIPTMEEITAIIPEFTGAITQIPPKYSAIKIDGKRAYDLAREGKEFEIKEREIVIESLKLISLSGNVARFLVDCSKGTYVRSLARDIALKLGTYGYVTYLKRTRIGKFSIENAILLSKLESIGYDAKDSLLPVETLLDDILAIALQNDKEFCDLVQGKQVKTNLPNQYDVLTCYQGKIVAISDINNGVIAPKRIIKGEY
ncbi:MAG: tRNA pseudouridine synthase B [Alphaproteobacteria bacterium ADurb.Bin438]|nr:MAG: tRNA pseudouridine synthase B [Alphaproteobacteria bacterium ADurb.Bin438]